MRSSVEIARDGEVLNEVLLVTCWGQRVPTCSSPVLVKHGRGQPAERASCSLQCMPAVSGGRRHITGDRHVRKRAYHSTLIAAVSGGLRHVHHQRHTPLTLVTVT